MTRLTFGGGIGFVAAMVAGAVSEVWFRGLFETQERGLDMFFFPSVSLGWLYGAVAIAIGTQVKWRGNAAVHGSNR